MKERLQKFLANAGVASRRRCEELIVAGYVTVNGETVTKLGSTIDPAADTVAVNGKSVSLPKKSRYIMLNKPYGVVCSKVSQNREEKTVYQFVPKSAALAIAGRLDKDSEGLVILTNDGDLVNRLTHPKYQHEKEYLVRTIKPLDDAALNRLRRGVRLKEGVAVADAVEVLDTANTYRIVIHQGWNRQIRRMIGGVRNDVMKLQRIRIGKLAIGSLAAGKFQDVSRGDIV